MNEWITPAKKRGKAYIDSSDEKASSGDAPKEKDEPMDIENTHPATKKTMLPAKKTIAKQKRKEHYCEAGCGYGGSWTSGLSCHRSGYNGVKRCSRLPNYPKEAQGFHVTFYRLLEERKRIKAQAKNSKKIHDSLALRTKMVKERYPGDGKGYVYLPVPHGRGGVLQKRPRIGMSNGWTSKGWSRTKDHLISCKDQDIFIIANKLTAGKGTTDAAGILEAHLQRLFDFYPLHGTNKIANKSYEKMIINPTTEEAKEDLLLAAEVLLNLIEEIEAGVAIPIPGSAERALVQPTADEVITDFKKLSEEGKSKFVAENKQKILELLNQRDEEAGPSQPTPKHHRK